jgi:hypothetical protein
MQSLKGLSELDARRVLRDDFETYAARVLKIVDKRSNLVPFRLNPAQRLIHARLEQQLKEIGMVRAIIPKARKQGASTYIGGRYFHKTTHRRGCKTVVLSHLADVSDILFDMVSTFRDEAPAALLPAIGRCSQRELSFPNLMSGYRVYTAGSKGAGRGGTPTLLHGSEAAYWPHAESTIAGLLNSIPDEDGTEIILESTANGPGDAYHQRWQMAVSGLSDWIGIFLPWSLSPEYRRIPDPDFQPTDEEKELMALHGLDAAQVNWRRHKIMDLGSEALFRHEYPITADEAFSATDFDSFIASEHVLRARKSERDGSGPLILGVDPQRSERPGADGFSVVARQGRKAWVVDRWKGLDILTAAFRVRGHIQKMNPDGVFVDAGGLGIGVLDALHGYGEDFRKLCKGVNFGGKPVLPTRYLSDGSEAPKPVNRRTEMWSEMRDWFRDPMGVDVEDDEALCSQLIAPGWRARANETIELERKEAMAKRGVNSPDDADALALTFAEPVGSRSDRDEVLKRLKAAQNKGGRSWMSG